jgi:hypothetical protein
MIEEFPGGHAKLKEISGSLKFHIHSLEAPAWKRRFVTAGLDTVPGI